MADYVLSQRADEDLEEIYVYSFREFGEHQADAYLLSLHDCFIALAENPGLGRDQGFILPNVFRFDHESHVIFYTVRDPGIFIVRVLHNSMDTKRHF